MKKNIDIKKDKVDLITEKIKESKSITVIEYHNINVAKINDIRNKLRESNCEMKVYKNSLFKLAAKKANFEDINETLLGPNAFIFSYEDPLIGPKIVHGFSKKDKNIKFKSGIYDGDVCNKEEITIIAKSPSKDELIGMFASSLLHPLRMFAISVKEIANKKQ